MRLVSTVAVALAIAGPALAQEPDCAPYLEQIEQQLAVARGEAPESTLMPDAPDDADRPDGALGEEEIAELAAHLEAARAHLAAGDQGACMTEVQSAQAITMPVEDSIADEGEASTGGSGQ